MQLEGRQTVLSALETQTQQIEKIHIFRNAHGQIIKDICDLARQQRIPVIQVEKQKLDQLSKTHNHQGVIAQLSAWQYSTLEQVLTNSTSKLSAPFLVMLDHLKDPHNFGSIIRTAEAAGVDGIIIPTRRSVGLTEVVMKVSAGAISSMPIVKVTNLAQTIDELKKKGFWVVGTDADGKQDIYDVDMSIPIVLLVGSEGQGLSRLLKEKSDHLVKLPMHGTVTSLNAAVAAGICIFEVARQRHDKH